MAWSAELHFYPLPEEPDRLIVTGTSNGKGPPRYTWGEELEPFEIQAYGADLERYYREGLYGTGSPGEVRDMLHAMQRVSDEHVDYLVLRVPPETARQAQQEAQAAAAQLPEGAVW